ncbi:MAG: ribonuclease H [Synechococcus sp. ELA619]
MTPDQSPPRVVAAACDGACSGNPGPGGWGSLLRFEDGSVQEFGAADPATTNNRMELKAALVLLECLKDLPCHPSLTIRTDSRYVIDGFSKWMAGWKRKGWRTASGSPVLNRELWEALDRARLPGVPFSYVKGHSGDPDNDRCDAIAVAFAKGGRPALAQASPQARASQGGSPSAGAATQPAPKAGVNPRIGNAGEPAVETGPGVVQPVVVADRPGLAEPGPEPAPLALGQLLSRLELADRLAAGGYSLSQVELAQLVQLPIKQLAEKASAWSWRDWKVLPHADGRWRLERDAAGSEPIPPGT